LTNATEQYKAIKVIKHKSKIAKLRATTATHRKRHRAFDWYQNRWPWMTLNRAMAV